MSVGGTTGHHIVGIRHACGLGVQVGSHDVELHRSVTLKHTAGVLGSYGQRTGTYIDIRAVRDDVIISGGDVTTIYR